MVRPLLMKIEIGQPAQFACKPAASAGQGIAITLCPTLQQLGEIKA